MDTGNHKTPLQVHEEAIFIDATSPLANSHPQLLDWWIEGGVTVVAPTVGGFDPSGPTLANLGRWNQIISEDQRLHLVTRGDDFAFAKKQGKLGIIYHFQGTTPLDNNADLVALYKQLGVGIIQLAYNVKNPIGDGCEERTDCGLSKLGLRVIEEMNEARVVVDCTHTGRQTTLDAIGASTRPVVFSHSNSKRLKPSPRNIDDEQIRAVANTGGLVGIVGFPPFVSSSTPPTLDQFVDHIDYMVNLAGIEHVGLGLDYFSGQAGVAADEEATADYESFIKSGKWSAEAYTPPPYVYPVGIETPRTFPNLTKRLIERGYSEDQVKKIIGGNWVRVFTEVWGE